MPAPIDDKLKQQIFELRKQSKTAEEIGEIIGRPQKTI